MIRETGTLQPHGSSASAVFLVSKHTRVERDRERLVKGHKITAGSEG